MNFDNLDLMHKIDADDMLGQLQTLPDQLEKGWELGMSYPFPDNNDIRHIIIAGMGGSAIGGDLIAAYLSPLYKIPILVHRDYDLPAWASGPETLVIACSHSGNTEETLSVFEQGIQRGCSLATLSTGGELSRRASEANMPHWTFEHHGMPRAAVGFSFSMLLCMINKLGLVEDPKKDLRKAAASMRAQQEKIGPQIPASQNPAKQLSQKLIGHWVAIIGSGYLAPIARRWKCQMNELAKAWTQFEFLPEADHNTLAGVNNPAEILGKTIVVFLDASSNHPRNKLRSKLTRKELSDHGLASAFYLAQGESPLEHMWTALHFGDYVSYYLAIAYNTDPSPIAAIENLKKAMK
jgi:glucose/mannose-6-phosphate isomerase